MRLAFDIGVACSHVCANSCPLTAHAQRQHQHQLTRVDDRAATEEQKRRRMQSALRDVLCVLRGRASLSNFDVCEFRAIVFSWVHIVEGNA